MVIRMMMFSDDTSTGEFAFWGIVTNGKSLDVLNAEARHDSYYRTRVKTAG